MLGPVLEVYLVWHPKDAASAAVAEALAEHFQGGAYAGLLAGSMEVYMRSAGWAAEGDAPRAIQWPGQAGVAGGLVPAQFVVVLALIGAGLNRAASTVADPWCAWFERVAQAQAQDPAQVRVLAVRQGVTPSGRLARLIGADQCLAEPDPHAEPAEPATDLICRDLVQALARWISPVPDERLQVFISHTKRQGTPAEPVASLVSAVREVIDAGRVSSFYDAHDLQPGERWDSALRDNAASCALLALRTDLYASREWCQREMFTAKLHGMPVVVLDALSSGESRGSFLMDHTPRIPVRCDAQGTWGRAPIRRALNLLADAWLQRVLWLRLQQQAGSQGRLAHYWWAPQAPEPSTLARWLTAPLGSGAGSGAGSGGAGSAAAADPEARPSQGRAAPRMPAQAPGSDLRILHPDPPLAEDERAALQQLVALAGYGQLDLTTPRLMAARGG